MAKVVRYFQIGIQLRGETADLSSQENGTLFHNSTDAKIKAFLSGTVHSFVTEAQTQTLTNKTISADNNSIQELETDNFKAGVIDTDGTLSANSDSKLATQKAVKTYVTAQIALKDQASEISYNNTSSGLTATNVQDAIDQVEARVDSAETNITTNATNISNHISDSSAAHAASAIDVSPTGNLTSSNVQNALQELQGDIDTINGNVSNVGSDLSNHLNDTTDAHDASAISNVPSGNLVATDVQSALNELQSDVDTRATTSELSSHASTSSGVHGVTGSVVGTSDSQTLTNKTIDAASNTISNISNTNINASAAIARSKLASGNANKVITNDGSGVMSEMSGVTNATNELTFDTTKHIALNAATDALTFGTNASLSSFTADAVRLTNVLLVSLANIPAGSNGQKLTLVNRTGNSVSIKDASGAIGTAANRILTGTGSDLSLTNDAAINLTYDSTTQRWQIVGGSGGASLPTFTANKAMISDALGSLTTSGTSSTEIGYLSGANANIQDQIDAKHSVQKAIWSCNFDYTGGVLGTTGTLETTSPLIGTKSFRIYPQVGSDGTGIQNIDIPMAARGKNVKLSFLYKTTLSQGYAKIKVTNVGNTVTYLEDTQITTNSSTFTGTTTASSNSITGISAADISKLKVGMFVYGSGITNNTYITAISGSTITISQNASASATVTIKNSGELERFSASFTLPQDQSQIRYTITAMYEAGSNQPSIIVDNVLLEIEEDEASFSILKRFNAEQIPYSSFSSGNATFLSYGSFAGTFAYESTSPLNNNISYKYTQASGSLNDWIASPTFNVPLRFRGSIVYMTMPYSYDGNSTDIVAVIYDVTNSTIISSVADYFTATGGAVSNIIFSCAIPSNCNQIKIGFQVKTANSGKILKFDDIQISSEIFSSTNLLNVTNWTSFGTTSNFTGFGTPSNISMEYRQVGENYEIRGRFDSGSGTATEARISLPNSSPIATFSGATVRVVGNFFRNSTGSGAASKGGPVVIDSAATYITFGSVDTFSGTTTNYLARAQGSSFSSGDQVSFFCTVPIKGLTASNPSVIVPNQQISSDTLSFVFKSTVIDPNTDPIGTFNTYTYASSSNTATIATTAPTQSVSSMNINGIQVFARAYNATSTAASPARVDIFIGKGLKSKQVDAYAAAAKSDVLSIDQYISGTSMVGTVAFYNEVTGILIIDAGYNNFSAITTRYAGYSYTAGTPASGYFVFNASKTPSLTAIPMVQPRVAYISDVKAANTAGGASTNTFTTRTLNTLVDSTGIVTSLSSNQFVLPAGKYRIQASAPAYACNQHQIKLRNITTSADTAYGTSEYSGSAAQTRSVLDTEVIITTSTTFEIQHRANIVAATNGFGVAANFGTSEIYTTVQITKVRE